MGTTPTELLKFSDELLTGPSESHHRSAASRAFLAAYHIVTDFLDTDLKIIRSGGSTYKALLSDLSAYKGGYGLPFNYKVQGLAFAFREIQTIRTKADYFIGEIFTKNEAAEAILRAKTIESSVMGFVEEIQNQTP